MTEGEFTEIGAAILDERFPEVDLMLRRGRHIDREDTSLYAYLTAAQAVLEALYRRFGCELVHKSDGYFYLLPTGDQLGRRQLSVSEMLVGQALALLYLDPRTLQSGGNVPRQEVLVHLASVMGTDALLRAFNPTKKKKIDERVAQETVRNRVAEALRKLATLGFVELLEGDQLRLRAALMRFAEPVRGLESPLEALQKLVAKGEVVLSVGDDAELDSGDDTEGDAAGDDADTDDSDSDDATLPDGELGDDDLGAEFDVESDDSAELGDEPDDVDENDEEDDDGEEDDGEEDGGEEDGGEEDDGEEETEREFAPRAVSESLDADGFDDDERADEESDNESDSDDALDSDDESDDAQDDDSDEPDSVAAPDSELAREPITANAVELAPDTAGNAVEVAHDSRSESDDDDDGPDSDGPDSDGPDSDGPDSDGEPDDAEPDSDTDDDESESDEIDEAQAAFDAEIQRARALHEALWEPFAQAEQHSAAASTADADAAPPTLNSETPFDESEEATLPLEARPLAPEPDGTKPAPDEAPVKDDESLEPPL